jgi:hypothetical protein
MIQQFSVCSGELNLPDMNGLEIKPNLILIGQPTPRPDLDPNKMACLANINGTLSVVELSINFNSKK